MYDYGDKIKLALRAKAEHISPPEGLKRKVLKEIDFLNKSGQFLGKVTVDTLDAEDPFDQIIQQLRPGMGKAIYIADNNPVKMISNQTNYEHEAWDRGIQELVERFHPYDIKLPLEAEIKAIHVMYGFDSLDEAEIDAMYAEAERSGERVVVRDLRKNNTLVGASIFPPRCFLLMRRFHRSGS